MLYLPRVMKAGVLGKSLIGVGGGMAEVAPGEVGEQDIEMQ